MTKDNKIQINSQCSICNGTGINKPQTESGKAGIICHICRGTGCEIIEYTPFTKRQLRTDVTRVYSDTHQYIIYNKDRIYWDNVIIPFSKYGCNYEDWLKGMKPIPIQGMIRNLKNDDLEEWNFSRKKENISTEQTKKIDIQCESCEGTGIYKGRCEKEESGVICLTCNGSGKDILEYIPFIERKLRTDIKRVYSETAHNKINDEDQEYLGKTIHFSKYGCTYDEWLQGIIPLTIKELICPFAYSGQSWKYLKCNDLKHGLLTSCIHFKEIEQCWKQYNYEQNK